VRGTSTTSAIRSTPGEATGLNQGVHVPPAIHVALWLPTDRYQACLATSPRRALTKLRPTSYEHLETPSLPGETFSSPDEAILTVVASMVYTKRTILGYFLFLDMLRSAKPSGDGVGVRGPLEYDGVLGGRRSSSMTHKKEEEACTGRLQRAGLVHLYPYLFRIARRCVAALPVLKIYSCCTQPMLSIERLGWC
jgi:hypothetical protein